MKSINPTLTTIELSELKQYFGDSSDKAGKSVCVYSETREDLSETFAKHDRIEQIEGGSLVTFSSSKRARKAVSTHHGKNGKIVCLGFTPPLIALGHNPDIFVIRNLVEEITIPQLWAFLDGDKNLVSHISILPTPNRDVVILCKDKEGQKQLLSKSGTKLRKWTIQIELWWEFCARLMTGKELFVENLPEGTTVDSLKTLLGVGDDDLEFVQFDEVHQVSLIVCKTRLIKQQISSSGLEELKFSLLPKLPSDNQVFINNLHETSTESDVQKLMSGCGNIMKVICWLDNKTGRKKARVIFEDAESTENALKLGGTELKDLPVSVCRLAGSQIPKTPTVKTSTPTTQIQKEVYIIATSCQLRKVKPIDLCLMFQECGYIEDVKMPPMIQFEKSTPAVIRFRDAEAVEKALSMRSSVRGLRLVVTRQKPRHFQPPGARHVRWKNSRGKRHGGKREYEDEESNPAKKQRVFADSNED
ncbi:uncharacterized protein LOC117640579 [Thrips palmi]|uniref:Uncharacterized protein LOC117640579 n=1 Tax=Thrips palmi TaxID=161013 RepID=A0A6P8YGH2_THRPL|nr:uncharacterized protein LOC117640579 [Thrips palmi]